MLSTTILVRPQDTAAPGSPPVEEGAPQSGGGSMFIPLILIGVVFWIILIGPERKNRKKREAMLGALAKGDKVMTTSGMLGDVVAIQDDIVTLQVADGVRLRFTRQAIQTVTETKDGVKPDEKKK